MSRLFGGVERESRLSQQRDYAAQLQEQVRAKQAQAEQEKTRRRQEQQRERELLDAQAQQAPTQAQRRAPPPLQMDAPPPLAAAPPSPSRSPLRVSPDHEIHHGSAMLNASPQKHTGGAAAVPVAGSDFPAAAALSFGSSSAAATLSPLVTSFTPGPSIFDSLLQSEPDRTLTNQIEALQSQRLDLENFWRQRRTAMQAIATKPQFIVVPPPAASASIPLSLDEKRQLDEEIYLSPRPGYCEDQQEQEDEPELTSNTSGLLGDSVLIPLMQVSPTKRVHAVAASSASPQRFVPSSPPRSNSAVHRRLAAATAAAASAQAESPVSPLSAFAGSSDLRHDSELLHFDQ